MKITITVLVTLVLIGFAALAALIYINHFSIELPITLRGVITVTTPTAFISAFGVAVWKFLIIDGQTR